MLNGYARGLPTQSLGGCARLWKPRIMKVVVCVQCGVDFVGKGGEGDTYVA